MTIGTTFPCAAAGALRSAHHLGHRPRWSTPGRVGLVAALLLLVTRAPDGFGQAVLSTHQGATGHQLGAAVCPAHDFDQDGTDDLLVGAPGASIAGSAAGRIEYISGLTGKSLLVREGPSTFARFGAAVERLIDYDGDGAPEYAIGAPGTGGSSPRGAVHIVHGKTLATILVIDGPSQSARFGEHVRLLNDHTGDGIPEFAVSASGFDNGILFGVGAVLIYNGWSAALIRLIPGQVAFDGLGKSMDRVPDTNGDGKSELIVGAPGADPAGIPGGGQASLIDPVTGTILRVYSGSAPGEAFGTTCAGVMDTNGDGLPEILVGAPAASPGGISFAGRAELIAAASGAVLQTFMGQVSGAQLGTTVAGLDDLDRDGRGDYVVGSPFATSTAGLAGAGRLTFYSGATHGLLWVLEGELAGANFGAAVRYAGAEDSNARPAFATGSIGKTPLGGDASGRVELRRSLCGILDIASTGQMGTQWSLTLRANPFSQAVLLLDTQPGSWPSAYGKLCLALTPQMQVAILPLVSASGLTGGAGTIPAVGIPANTTFHMQCLASDPIGFAGFLTTECTTLTIVP